MLLSWLDFLMAGGLWMIGLYQVLRSARHIQRRKLRWLQNESVLLLLSALLGAAVFALGVVLILLSLFIPLLMP